jgi:hypothetical protein
LMPDGGWNQAMSVGGISGAGIPSLRILVLFYHLKGSWNNFLWDRGTWEFLRTSSGGRDWFSQASGTGLQGRQKKVKDIPKNVLYLRHISRDSDDVDNLSTSIFYLIENEKERFFLKKVQINLGISQSNLENP